MYIVRKALLIAVLLTPLLAPLLTVGCGPIEYISIVTFEASHAVSAAKGVHADRLAPYEYTAAVEYLHKARELGGYSRYHQSVDFGRKARDFGNQAFDMAKVRSGKPAEEKHE
jgi:hypothetical protein